MHREGRQGIRLFRSLTCTERHTAAVIAIWQIDVLHWDITAVTALLAVTTACGFAATCRLATADTAQRCSSGFATRWSDVIVVR